MSAIFWREVGWRGVDKFSIGHLVKMELWSQVGYWDEDKLHRESRLQLDSEIQGTESAAGKLQWAAPLTNESVAELGQEAKPRKVGEGGTEGHLSSLHNTGSNLWFE